MPIYAKWPTLQEYGNNISNSRWRLIKSHKLKSSYPSLSTYDVTVQNASRNRLQFTKLSYLMSPEI